MEYSCLYDLIRSIELGTKMHIGVVFLGAHGSEQCRLPDSHTMHPSPVCELFKSRPRGLERCMKCRSYALRRAIRDKAAFGALCINGVYEYTHPVVVDAEVIAVIFIGNILTEDGKIKLSKKAEGVSLPLDTMQSGPMAVGCESVAGVIESYIIMLEEKYPPAGEEPSAVIDNVKSYVAANLEYDHRLAEVASLFFYNEAYLGRLFLKETGESFNDYLNRERVARAKHLLRSGLRVTEVSWRVGYNSVSYFNRIFKRVTGVTPTEYKAMQK